MELDEVMRTTGAVREFTADAVPDGVLHRILDRARFAPSGGNQQGWHVTIVRGPNLRRRLGQLSAATGTSSSPMRRTAPSRPWCACARDEESIPHSQSDQRPRNSR